MDLAIDQDQHVVLSNCESKNFHVTEAAVYPGLSYDYINECYNDCEDNCDGPDCADGLYDYCNDALCGEAGCEAKREVLPLDVVSGNYRVQNWLEVDHPDVPYTVGVSMWCEDCTKCHLSEE